MNRVVAREGLILMVFIFTLACLFFSDKYINTKINENIYVNEKIKEDLTKHHGNNLTIDEISMQTGFSIEHKKKYYDYQNYIVFIALIILFIYPLYLIVRFIIWAIKTLRSTEDPHLT